MRLVCVILLFAIQAMTEEGVEPDFSSEDVDFDKSVSDDLGECEQGQLEVRDNSTCLCGSGTWNCGPQHCNSGEVKEADCSSCSCLKGLWFCIPKACVRKTVNSWHENPLSNEPENPDECKSGQFKTKDEIMCFCGKGSWHCTPVCKEGEIKKSDCSSCICTKGWWFCRSSPECAHKTDTSYIEEPHP